MSPGVWYVLGGVGGGPYVHLDCVCRPNTCLPTYQGQPREPGGGGNVDGEARGGHEDQLADVLGVEVDEVEGDGPAHGGAHDVVGPRSEILLQREEELRQLACGGVEDGELAIYPRLDPRAVMTYVIRPHPHTYL